MRPAPSAPRRRCGRPSRIAVGVAIVLTVALATTVATPGAQPVEAFRGRLAPLPVDFATADAITGQGMVTGELRGFTLTVSARFEGLSSPIAAAHLHRAPKARRGEPALALDIGDAAARAGVFSDTVTLTDDLAAALRDESLYLQIQTTGNPQGEIRGWLLRVPRN